MIATGALPVRPQGKAPGLPLGVSEGQPRTVLVVEDDAVFSEMLQSLFESIPCKSEVARNGAEAVKRILLRDYDFILCDMVMPEFPGEMFYRAVERVRPRLCQRVIFMTGHRNDQEITQFVRSINGVLLWKPFEFAALLEAMMTIELQGELGSARRAGKAGRSPHW